MFLDPQGQPVEGLAFAFAAFLTFMVLMRVGTRIRNAARVPFFFMAWLLLTVTATFRVVEEDRGGGYDSAVYRRLFESAEGAQGRTISTTGTGAADEPLHLGLVRFIRLFTDDYHVYFFVVHGIITFGVVYFIAKTLKAEYPILPLLVMFPSWLGSLSVMRNWVAIALLLIALTFYMQKRLRGYYLWAILAIGFHYSAVLFLLFPPVAAFLTKQHGIVRKIVVVVVMNLVILGSSSILARVLAGSRYEQYLSWDEANFPFVAPLLAIALVGLVFVQPSEALGDDAKRIAMFLVFAAGLTTLILYFGGFRYMTYTIVPQAVVAAFALSALKTRFSSSLLLRVIVSIAIYVTLYFEASATLRSVINLSGVFPLKWDAS